MPGTRKLGRATSHRTAMLRGLVTFLLENGKIETTVTRAKEVRALTEKMITIAKEDSLHNKRLVMAFVTKKTLLISYLQRLLLNMQTVMVVIHVLQSWVQDVATLQRWQLSN